MSLSVGKRTLFVLLALSLLLNVATVSYLAKSGALRRALVRMDLAEFSEPREDFQKGLEARYRKFPNTQAEVVFAGDSLIGSGPWSEFYSEIHNRGIGGDTTSALLGRLDEITESKPREIVLLIGTNDLAKAIPVAQMIRNYRSILERIRKDSPGTMIHAIGILPVNPAVAGKITQTNAKIAEFNEQLKKLVAEFPGVKFVDLSAHLADKAGKLRNDFYIDSIHLNDDGYLGIREAIAAVVAEPSKAPITNAEP